MKEFKENDLVKIVIEGQDALQATKELLNIEGLKGSYEILDGVERGEVERGEVNKTLVTIATGVAIASGTLSIADQLYQWKERIFQNPTSSGIEKVIIVDHSGNRLLLKDASVKQIQEILDNE